MNARPLDPNLAAILASIRVSVGGGAEAHEPGRVEASEGAPPPSPAPRVAAVAAGGGETLEGFVARLMAPHIREWLDANLPEMVQREVSAAVERLVGKA